MGQHSRNQKQKLNAEATEINAEVAKLGCKKISKQDILCGLCISLCGLCVKLLTFVPNCTNSRLPTFAGSLMMARYQLEYVR
jgi:hypothetical protein